MEGYTTHWQGKKVCFLGDSITAGVGVPSGCAYWNYLEEYLHIIPTSYGINGYKYAGLLKQAEAMYEEKKDDVDAIFVFAGTNDFKGDIPLGEWYTESERLLPNRLDESLAVMQTRKYREFNFDTKTFKGSINTVLGFLKKHYHDKKIVLLTPLHRAYATFGENNVQYDEMHSNSIGLFVDEYVNAVKEAANVWATELVDLNSISGLFPLNDDNAEKYFCKKDTDRLHPNAEGHKKIAKALARKMTTIDV